MNANDPHHAEYLAAVGGMQDTYGTTRPHQGRGQLIDGRLHTTWSKGDYVTFRLEDGTTLGGHVIDVLIEAGDDSEYHIAAHVPGKGRQHFAVKNRDVLVF